MRLIEQLVPEHVGVAGISRRHHRRERGVRRLRTASLVRPERGLGRPDAIVALREPAVRVVPRGNAARQARRQPAGEVGSEVRRPAKLMEVDQDVDVVPLEEADFPIQLGKRRARPMVHRARRRPRLEEAPRRHDPNEVHVQPKRLLVDGGARHLDVDTVQCDGPPRRRHEPAVTAGDPGRHDVWRATQLREGHVRRWPRQPSRTRLVSEAAGRGRETALIGGGARVLLGRWTPPRWAATRRERRDYLTSVHAVFARENPRCAGGSKVGDHGGLWFQPAAPMGGRASGG